MIHTIEYSVIVDEAAHGANGIYSASLSDDRDILRLTVVSSLTHFIFLSALE